MAHYDAGISYYDKAKNNFEKITANKENKKALSTDRIYGLAFLSDGNIWARSCKMAFQELILKIFRLKILTALFIMMRA